MTTGSHKYSNESNDEVSLKELLLNIGRWWQYLLSKWVIILGFGLLGSILGLTYSIFKMPIYTATTTFVLEDEKSSSSMSNFAGLASIAGVDLGGGGGGGIFQGDNILGLYKSRTMLEQTLLTPIVINGKQQLLVNRYIDFNNLIEKWNHKTAINSLFQKNLDGKISANRLRDSVLGVIVGDLNKNYLTVAKPDKKLSAIQVDVKASDEIFAKAFNDALVANVNEFYINTKTKKTLTNVQILQRKTDSVRAVINGAIYTSVAIGDATPNINPTRQVQRVAPAQKAQFSAEMSKSILNEIVKNLEMTKMALLKETPLVQIIDQPIYPLKKESFGKIKGIVTGGMLFGVLMILFLSVKLFLKNILGE